MVIGLAGGWVFVRTGTAPRYARLTGVVPKNMLPMLEEIGAIIYYPFAANTSVTAIVSNIIKLYHVA
jgi:hypothetical protein